MASIQQYSSASLRHCDQTSRSARLRSVGCLHSVSSKLNNVTKLCPTMWSCIRYSINSIIIIFEQRARAENRWPWHTVTEIWAWVVWLRCSIACLFFPSIWYCCALECFHIWHHYERLGQSDLNKPMHNLWSKFLKMDQVAPAICCMAYSQHFR